MLIRGIKRLRFVTRAVMTIQVASVTFIPVVHPYLHARPTTESASVCPHLPTDGRPPYDLGFDDKCLICSAQPGLPNATSIGVGAPPETAVHALSAPLDAEYLNDRLHPANRVRAPPQI
jgi:hypothetical protein